MISLENFPNAYKETYVILKNMDKEFLDRVPKAFFEILEENMNNDYVFEINNDTNFKDIKLLKETKSMLAYVFINFWSDEIQVKFIKEKFKQDIIKSEMEKLRQYQDIIFPNNKKNDND